MTTELATLIAAAIAATASVAELFFNRFSENRASFRALLQPIIAQLGEAMYSIVASANVMVETTTTVQFSNWYGKAIKEREKLKALRSKARYPLWGLDEGIRVLIRVPDWASHARSDKKRADKLLKRADALRHVMDVVALRCYRNGRLPDLLEVWQVKYRAWQCRSVFINHESHSNQTQTENPDLGGNVA